MTKPLLRTLDEIEGADFALVGGKAFRLATLKQHQFNVPQGLVLTTAFFETQLQHCQLTPLWAGSPDVAVTTESLEWLANTLKLKALAPQLLESLNNQLEATFGPDIDRFAIRSSAIDEDQRDHTFAGVHLTELGVPRSVIPIAITRCWASALSGPALQYRLSHGMSIQGIRIAVLIQPMLVPTSSGVGFTVNPLTGARDELVIEAIQGLGKALVGGEIQPYFYRLSTQPPDYPLLERRTGSDTRSADDPASANAEPLPTTALTELALQLEQIQALMGEAQDVEWAWQDGSFVFLQTRPAIPPPEPIQTVDQEWTRGSHPEFLPELPSPLFASLLERTQKQALTFFTELGLELGGLGPYVRLILGRPYLNLTLLKRIIAQVGVNPGAVLHTISHTEPGARGNTLSIDWETVWKTRWIYGRVLKRIMFATHSLNKYKALVAEASQVLAEVEAAAPPVTLLAQLRLQERLYCELFNTSLGLTSGISAITTIGSWLIVPLTKTPAALLSALALKGVKTSEGELNRALVRQAEQWQHNEQIQDYLSNSPEKFDNFAQNPAISTEFKNSFAELLAKYGHRAVYEADLGWPRYAEDPTPLLNIIRQYIQSKHPAGQTALEIQPRRYALTWANATEPGRGLSRIFPWRRWLAVILVSLLRRLLKMREVLHTVRGQAMTACRRWNLALGKSWVSRGWLIEPDDMFWLTLDEIERTLMVAEDVGITLSSTVQARKETYQTYAQTKMPFTLPESQIPYIQPGLGLSTKTISEVMMGLPISPGQVQGAVLVLQNPGQFERLTTNTIVVMPSTDPAWLPLLHLADGLIVETGGLLSHGSVIAREYGIPAVANIPHATKQFQTGDRVLVDGSTGIVQLLEAAPSKTG